PDVFGDHLVDFLGKVLPVAIFPRLLKDDESIEGAPLDIVGEAYNGGFRHRRVLIDGILDGRSTQVVTRYDHHIIHSAGDPVIAHFVPKGPVPRKIFILKGGEIGFLVTLMVLPDGPGHARPWKLDA